MKEGGLPKIYIIENNFTSYERPRGPQKYIISKQKRGGVRGT
jgi:hypothetical protein